MRQFEMFGDGRSRERSREWIFAPLEQNAYSLMVIDPPWKYRTWSIKGLGKSPDQHYRTMTIEEIADLPVADLAAKDCVLWLWATQPMLDQQIEIMKGWGFRYVSHGSWVKRTKNGKLAIGTGYSLRNSHDTFLIGSIGKPKYVDRGVRSVVEGPIRENSRKPDEAYTAARRLVPYGRAADVFSRETRPTFENWGDEATLFDRKLEDAAQ